MPPLISDFTEIRPNHFFRNEGEKTRFNWFAFELACEIDKAVSFGTKRALSKKGYTKQSFNKSCIHLAKLLQPIILKKLNGEIEIMEIGYKEVEIAFPGLNDKMVNKLVNFMTKAWDNLLKVCETCPSACITNRHLSSKMFDDEFYYPKDYSK